jgi:hypothetical protein
MFSGRGPPDPHIFLTNHIRAGGNGTGGKIGASEAIQKRLEWENLMFFAAYIRLYRVYKKNPAQI